MQVNMPNAPPEPAKLESTELRPTTEMDDFQQRILEDLGAVQTKFRADDAGLSSDAAPQTSRALDEKRPKLGRAGTSLSEGHAPYAAMRALTAGEADSVDIAAPGGVINKTHSDSPPDYGPEARPSVPREAYDELVRQLQERSRENADLRRQLADQTSKTTHLQRLLVRSSKKDDSPDSEIRQKFLILKSDILQFVKGHLSAHLDAGVILSGIAEDATHEGKELWLRSAVAGCLYDWFFSPALFGFADHLGGGNPLRKFEERLKASQCDEALVREWRVLTVKASKSLSYDCTRLTSAAARDIWPRFAPIIPAARRSSQSKAPSREGPSPRTEAFRALERLCEQAYDLGLLFRGSSVEYQWEQEISMLRDRKVLDGYEIVGAEGPEPSAPEEAEVAFVVFGCVVRGEKGSGLLANGRTRLGSAQVVVRRRTAEG